MKMFVLHLGKLV